MAGQHSNPYIAYCPAIRHGRQYGAKENSALFIKAILTDLIFCQQENEITQNYLNTLSLTGIVHFFEISDALI
jgi:hypothetical protein